MNLIFYPENGVIDLNGRRIRLTKNVAAVMELLWKADGGLCSHDDIGVYVYGSNRWYNGCANNEAVEQLVSRLRGRLAPYGHDFIKTRRNLGWYLVDYEPGLVMVEVTPGEAVLLRAFRALSPMEQEMVIASQALGGQQAQAGGAAVEQPAQLALFDCQIGS